ncbi:copper oxidase [Aestuariivirga litoralis]|uniref:Copper oxidase n=1 Tax=Aestuariivirga litoralis TaxID=2650924 RepID=A0A2W2AUU9_9HYPH|nr:multicopper oxidase domain-containing protein [Aestuariivirga litoralis]PZF79025.1 copper oxidase [Aestuariivirga litoralis]
MNRREILLAGLAGTSLMGLPRLAVAEPEPKLLTVSKRVLEVKGRAATVYGLTGPDGKPGLSMMFGEHFRVRVKNDTDSDTIIHWHGLTPPFGQDGVAMYGEPAIAPGASKDYDFANTRAGTHWMHSHMGLQEQQLLAAPLIVNEVKQPVFDDHEHVVMLHDFTFRNPQEILAELQGGGGAHAGHTMHGSSQGMDHSQMNHSGSNAGGGMMQGMAGMMGGAGMLNDIVFDAYLANDRTLDDPEVVTVEKNTTLRLRIINGAAASNMWVDLGAMEGELVAVDGNAIYPMKGSLFPLAMAQRADIRLTIPAEGGAFPVLFRPEGVRARTGIIVASKGAAIPRLAGEGDMAPALDLSQELLYRAVAKLPQEPVNRTEMLMLTGGETNYLWGLNGEADPAQPLFTMRQGERIAVMMHNMTGMAHPMHLHGHYFKVMAIGKTVIDGALRDVVLVPPMESVTIVFDADNPGSWPFHCHHAYHMNSGMMGTVGYTSAA